MELLQLPSIPVLVFSFLFLLLLIKKRGFTSCRNESYLPRRPPGPWNLPFVGSMHHLVGQLPFRAFRELARKHGPLMLLRLGQVDVVVVSSREAAEEILKNQSVTFASRPELLSTKFVFYGPTGIVWAPYGPYWRQLLKLCCMELFSAGRIRSFSPIRTEETLDLMRDIATSGGTTVNLTEKLSVELSSNAIVVRQAAQAPEVGVIPVIKILWRSPVVSAWPTCSRRSSSSTSSRVPCSGCGGSGGS
ncbi:unnamed protein product [Musa acuminata subsp. burmannicoides]